MISIFRKRENLENSKKIVIPYIWNFTRLTYFHSQIYPTSFIHLYYFVLSTYFGTPDKTKFCTQTETFKDFSIAKDFKNHYHLVIEAYAHCHMTCCIMKQVTFFKSLSLRHKREMVDGSTTHNITITITHICKTYSHFSLPCWNPLANS